VCDKRCGQGQWNSAANGAMYDRRLQIHITHKCTVLVYCLLMQCPVFCSWDCLWINDIIDCSQPVQVQFIDGSSYSGSVHFAAASPSAAGEEHPSSSCFFNSPPPVTAPVFNGVGCLNFFDGFT
jgi:hypothetical protein